MRASRAFVLAVSGVVAWSCVVLAQAPGQAPTGRATESTYRAPRTPWGDPDLQGRWPGSNASAIPLQRPEALGTRNVLTDAEFAERQAQAARVLAQDVEDFDFEHPSVPFGQVGGGQSPPQHWFERAAPQRQASLIVDPPNGRLPAQTAAARKIDADRRADSDARGAAASYTDFTLYERCITRGLTGSILPGGYNNGNEIVQAPGYVVIVNEMIHESRIVPLNGGPDVRPALKRNMGESRGRWDGDTLVVETTNFVNRAGVGMNNTGASEKAKVTERFTRTSDKTIRYTLTIDDPVTWTAPFTLQYDLGRDDGYGMFEYACHEGNYALQNIMRGARVQERAAGSSRPR